MAARQRQICAVATILASILCGYSSLSPNAIAKAEPSSPPPASASDSSASFDDTQSRAFVLVMQGKNADAKKVMTDAIKAEKDTKKRLDLNYMLAAIERMDEDYDDAIDHLQPILNAQGKAQSSEDHLNHALLFKRIADCYYGKRDTQPALVNYRAALAECDAISPDTLLTAPILEAITGTLVYAKKYPEAETTGKQLLELTSKHAASGRIEDVGAFFWAKLQLLGIYRHMGSEDERKKLWESSTPLLDQLLSMRAQLDSTERIPDLEKTKREFEDRYISEFHPKTPAEYLWLASEFKMRTLPLIQWAAKADKAKAAVLCIHGLGLENRAFTAFGREMAERGYSIYALDVRGFGAWQATQGQEDVQFKETLKDIGTVLRLIKQREHDTPIFLLGESMGGAIALRGAAEYGSSIAGVISSVPSAEIFQERRMALTVAFHLLAKGSNKPFRVGDMVTDQATKNEDLAERWKSDSKAKMDMTPKELIKFAVFMRTTKGECEKITTPVFVIQGLKDRLVKPEGTIQLFEAVKGADKNLLIIGTAEHLIFETFTPSKFLVDALCTWIDDHSSNKPSAKESADAATQAQ